MVYINFTLSVTQGHNKSLPVLMTIVRGLSIIGPDRTGIAPEVSLPTCSINRELETAGFLIGWVKFKMVDLTSAIFCTNL